MHIYIVKLNVTNSNLNQIYIKVLVFKLDKKRFLVFWLYCIGGKTSLIRSTYNGTAFKFDRIPPQSQNMGPHYPYDVLNESFLVQVTGIEIPCRFEGDFHWGRDVGGFGVTIVVGDIKVFNVFISFHVLRQLNFGCEFVNIICRTGLLLRLSPSLEATELLSSSSSS